MNSLGWLVVSAGAQYGNVGHVLQQRRKVRHLRRATHGVAPGIHVLAQQGHFLHALVGQARHLDQDVFERPVDLGAAGVGHHAVLHIGT